MIFCYFIGNWVKGIVSNIFGIKKAQSFSFSVLCVVGVFCSHVSSNLFSIGKYPFFIYENEHKNFALKKRKSLEKSRLFGAISFLSPFDVCVGLNLVSRVCVWDKKYFLYLPLHFCKHKSTCY